MMNKKIGSLMYIFATAIVLGVIFLFRDLVWVWLVQPAAFTLWAVWRVLASVDQVVYWYLLICIIVFLLLRHIPNEPQENSAYANHIGSSVKGSENWKILLSSAMADVEKRQLLRQALENLLINALVLREHSERETVKNRLLSRVYPFPIMVYTYFYPNENNWLARMRRSLRESGWVLPGWLRLDKEKYRQSIQTILSWMEDYLEAPFDESANQETH